MHKDTKPIFFIIDENVTGFSFRVYPETVSDTLFPAGYTYGMDYVWNGLENYYELSQPYIRSPAINDEILTRKVTSYLARMLVPKFVLE